MQIKSKKAVNLKNMSHNESPYYEYIFGFVGEN